MLFFWGCEQTLVYSETAKVVQIHQTEFVFSRDQGMTPRYTMGCGPTGKSADPADARETSR